MFDPAMPAHWLRRQVCHFARATQSESERPKGLFKIAPSTLLWLCGSGSGGIYVHDHAFFTFS